MGLGLLNRIRDVLLALALVLLFPPVRSRGAAGTGLRKSPRGILELNFFLCYTEKLAVLYCTVYRDRDSTVVLPILQYSTVPGAGSLYSVPGGNSSEDGGVKLDTTALEGLEEIFSQSTGGETLTTRSVFYPPS